MEVTGARTGTRFDYDLDRASRYRLADRRREKLVVYAPILAPGGWDHRFGRAASVSER